MVLAGLAFTGAASAEILTMGQNTKNCENFNYQEDAQAEFDRNSADLNGLDADNDGMACEGLPRRGTAGGQPATSTTTAKPAVRVADMDCADFPTQAASQAVLSADRSDPNRLDADGDGIACETRFGEQNATAKPTSEKPKPESSTHKPKATTSSGNQVKIRPAGGVDTGDGSMVPASGGSAGVFGGLLLIGVAGGAVLMSRRPKTEQRDGADR